MSIIILTCSEGHESMIGEGDRIKKSHLDLRINFKEKTIWFRCEVCYKTFCWDFSDPMQGGKVREIERV